MKEKVYDLITEELKQIIEDNFEIKVNRELSNLIQDGFNKVYLIMDSTQKFIFRMADSKKSIKTTEEDYLYELDLLQFLKNKNFPVSYPLKLKDDSYLLKIEKNDIIKYCSLFSFAEGTPLQENDENKHFFLGIFVAQLHIAMRSFNSRYKRYHWDYEKSLDYPVELFKEYLSEEFPNEYNELFKLKEWLKQVFSKNTPKLPSGLVHGDIHNFNVHFDDNNSFTMFDFDFLGTNYIIFDISCFIGTEMMFFYILQGKDVPNSLTRAQMKFIEGYESVRKLSHLEIKLLPLTEIERNIILFGSWAHFYYFRGSEHLDNDDKPLKDYIIERIRKIFPHLLTLKSKWEKNDLYYYNDLKKDI